MSQKGSGARANVNINASGLMACRLEGVMDHGHGI